MAEKKEKTYPSQLDKVKEITDQLEAGIEKLFDSDAFKQYLTTLSKFHDYSLNNTLLIAMQKPDATLVAGYTAWQKQFGRQVLKGAKAIRILAPAPYKKKMEVDKTDPHTGEILTNPDGSSKKEVQEIMVPAFKVVNVFDVSQTDGKELPSIGVNELTGEVSRFDDFMEALKKTCPVPIGFEQIDSGAKGYFHTVENRIAIQEGMSQVQTMKTAIHEMAHQKVNGDPPGQELKSYSYSIKEFGELLDVDDSVAYDIIKRCRIETFTVGSWKRIRKDVFEAWYNSQSRYRTPEDRERDAEREEATITMPEMARLLMISRKEVYSILASPKNEGVFEYEVIADRKRITKDSFWRWYTGQDVYHTFEDLPAEEQFRIERLKQEAVMPRLKVAVDKPSYDLQETAVLLDMSYREVRALIKDGYLEARQFGNKKYVLRDDLQWFLLQQKLNCES